MRTIEEKKEADRIAHRKFYLLHKEEERTRMQKYKDEHREETLQNMRDYGRKTHRARSLLKKYGITLDDYEKMYLEQDGRCKLCLREEKLLFVDHCHATGKVRGLLCNSCNKALGLFHDNKDALRRAVDYV